MMPGEQRRSIEGDSVTILDSILDSFCNILGDTWIAAAGCLRIPVKQRSGGE
jgi:hypothetical protein